ncbi:isochorismatase [Alkalihalobacillus alcalophilus ATCC 27647 = CGMCC 1.3604]|uniref:Isochorismatase n=1 Tax=Alkalihalobacillus alcalophilus ATCC 27647 = CGMCC 1.3604 TaxID=1218173 RepID=A0A094YTY0_ALKAL|nr:isochorismatase family protein [Alkalihalobacillus alcalophilus]KGA96937.1 isochorismatase [Alkalihalobacillus alcalophilus ATCC 27647 = CGMCC 1.3604]MED1562291.1 isochorismatase family protein [Alkalihalobacillus alcalophilus]THG88807.1 isochorismatase [Alkalihalobacillus alcalophilus ATCC 27647 = CGMCC 1.3604]
MNQALLIIDAQQELMDGNSDEKEVFQKDKLIANINSVIKQALAKGVHIIFVRDKDVADGRGAGFQVHNKIKIPTSPVTFINKEATNSFYNTNLLPFLQWNQIEHLVIMGCKTEHCIDTAVRTATVNSFDVTLVGNGHSTTDSKTLSAEKIIAHHNELLDGHYNVDNFSVVRYSDENLFEPNHNQYR